MDPNRFDADPDPTFHFDADIDTDPDPDSDPDPAPKLYASWIIIIFFTFIHSNVSLHGFFFLISGIIFSILNSILKSLHLVEMDKDTDRQAMDVDPDQDLTK